MELKKGSCIKLTERDGKYTPEYGEKFGVELVPCIQTPAHLSNALRRSFADGRIQMP